MFGTADLINEITALRKKTQYNGDAAISEARKILKKDLFAEKKILQNLNLYKSSFSVADEEDLDRSKIWSLQEIKEMATLYRLKFLESRYYKPEIPFEVTARLQNINEEFKKEIKDFYILSVPESFKKANSDNKTLVLLRTNYDNYYVMHSWGKELAKSRKLLYWPLRRFETLIITILIATLIIDLSLPTRLITLDHKAVYWSGYRAAAFFHLLIFNSGVTVYFTFAFARNFSSTVWNRYKDF
ncbi:hypothetical protein CNR22_11080 [Sphingobacteriaceae bacterium]|nr:hypothetical protein CNR22_11080 [Sphingobacteriaceae bacterium]